jgi:hypothetical protein
MPFFWTGLPSASRIRPLRSVSSTSCVPISDDVPPSPALPPYPTGRYAVGFSDDVRSGDVVLRPLMGGDVVVYGKSSGRPHAVAGLHQFYPDEAS